MKHVCGFTFDNKKMRQKNSFNNKEIIITCYCMREIGEVRTMVMETMMSFSFPLG
jgi:hypothetical protein